MGQGCKTGTACTPGKEKVQHSESPLLHLCLVVGFPAGLGGDDSSDAKTGVVAGLIPKQDVHETRFLLVWILACTGMCDPFHIPHHSNSFFDSHGLGLSSGFHCHDQSLELSTQLFNGLCCKNWRHFGMTAKNS